MSTDQPADNDSALPNVKAIEPSKSIAVALEDQGDSSPKVVASGKGFVAEKILELAFANDIKVREDKDLVQILAAVDVDSPIPTNAFAAVAEILSYLYQANSAPPGQAAGASYDQL